MDLKSDSAHDGVPLELNDVEEVGPGASAGEAMKADVKLLFDIAIDRDVLQPGSIRSNP